MVSGRWVAGSVVVRSEVGGFNKTCLTLWGEGFSLAFPGHTSSDCLLSWLILNLTD